MACRHPGARIGRSLTQQGIKTGRMHRFLSLFLPVLAVAVVAAVIVAGINDYRGPSSEDPPAAPGPAVSVIDGDTIQVGRSVIELFGIDAPELGQRCVHDGQWFHCGVNAAVELRALIQKEHSKVECKAAPGAAPGSSQVCLAGPVDLARFLLKSGYVVTVEETTEGYQEAEGSARQSGLGLWHSDFVAPAAWRSGQRLPGELDAGPEDCPVKAVISASGERFYYVPTDDSYQGLSEDALRGGQSFCSDEEARQAGWHREGEAAAGAAIDRPLSPYGIATVVE